MIYSRRMAIIIREVVMIERELGTGKILSKACFVNDIQEEMQEHLIS